MWLGMGTVSHGIARVAAGEHEALAELVEGMTLLESAGAGQAGAPWVIYLLAEAQQTSRQYLEAFGTVESALEVGARTGQPFWDADLHRLKAELVLETGGGEAEAEELLRRALDIARAQEAKSFELRAATSLARLLRDQNRVAEARAELAPVYGWFTEGFDTQDLKDAKALLEELL
jgi:predicted ATPase